MRNCHINNLELRAVLRSLRYFRKLVRNKVVAVWIDNTTALSYLRKQGDTMSSSLFREARKILLWTEENGVTLKPCFVPGERNVTADRLSSRHQILTNEWSLHKDICQMIWRKWGTPEVDLFATWINSKLPRYVSPVPDPQAWAIDAMAINWNNRFVYAYPPTKLIHLVANRLQEGSKTKMILVAPFCHGFRSYSAFA